jgi:hypothetical protein
MTIISEASKNKKGPQNKTKQTNKNSKALANPNNKTRIVRIIIMEGASFPWPETETLKTGNFCCKTKENLQSKYSQNN